MEQVRFASGQILVEQGTPSEHVYVIKSGIASVSRREGSGGEARPLARLKEGDVVGEMAAVSGEPHGATVTAETELVAHRVSREAFVASLSNDPGAALPTLRAVLERLRSTDARLVRAETALATPIKWEQIRLVPASPSLADEMPPGGLIIRNLPFRIGRRSVRKKEASPAQPVHLVLKDREPFLLSALHCAVEDTAMGPVVRDLGSKTGTIVNGNELGGALRHLVAPLAMGQNDVILGGRTSAFHLHLVVEDRESPPRRRVPGA